MISGGLQIQRFDMGELRLYICSRSLPVTFSQIRWLDLGLRCSPVGTVPAMKHMDSGLLRDRGILDERTARFPFPDSDLFRTAWRFAAWRIVFGKLQSSVVRKPLACGNIWSRLGAFLSAKKSYRIIRADSSKFYSSSHQTVRGICSDSSIMQF